MRVHSLLVLLCIAAPQIIIVASSRAGPFPILFAKPTSPCAEAKLTAGACGHVALAQIRMPLVRAEVRILRIRVASGIRLLFRKTRTAVIRVGSSLRSAGASLRVDIQRRFVASICCRQRIQSNIIEYDLSRRFPSSTIERDVKLSDQFGNRKRSNQLDGDDLGIIVDLVLDHGSLKLVFESCYETEQRTAHSYMNSVEPQYVVVNEGNQQTRIEVTRAEKLQACLKFESGEITYHTLN